VFFYTAARSNKQLARIASEPT